MKHLGLFYLLLIISLSVKAQTEQGRWQVGAEVNQLKYEELTGVQTNSKVLLTPSVGYFLTRNLVVSVGMPLGLNSSVGTYLRDIQTRIGVSPALRYYLGKSNLKPFLSFSYSYLANKTTNQLIDDRYRYSINDHSNVFIPSVGLSYRLGYRLTLTTTLNYVIDNYHIANGEPRDLTITALPIVIEVFRPNQKALSIGVGIQFFFKNS